MISLPSPAGDNSPNDEPDANHSQADSGRKRRGHILDVEECQARLTSLLGAVALGFLSPKQANAMRGILAELLRSHQRSDSRGAGVGIPDADIVELMRKDPKVFAMFEPYLTDEQIDQLMKDSGDAEDG